MKRKTTFYCLLLAAVLRESVCAAVTLTNTTTDWKTLEHSYTSSYEFEWSNNNEVTKTFNALVMENEYLKVTLVPEYGGRISSMIYKPTGHEELYQTPVGTPFGIGDDSFYYNWLIVYAGIFPTFPEPEHGKYYLVPWQYQVLKETADTVSVKMSQTDTIDVNFCEASST